MMYKKLPGNEKEDYLYHLQPDHSLMKCTREFNISGTLSTPFNLFIPDRRDKNFHDFIMRPAVALLPEIKIENHFGTYFHRDPQCR